VNRTRSGIATTYPLHRDPADAFMVSVRPRCIVTQIALADVSGRGQAVAVFAAGAYST
jgi:hypothetical protein